MSASVADKLNDLLSNLPTEVLETDLLKARRDVSVLEGLLTISKDGDANHLQNGKKVVARQSKSTTVHPAQERKRSVANLDEQANRVGKYLLDNGPTKYTTIIEKLSIKRDTFYKVIKMAWFEKAEVWKYTLSADGFAHFNADKEDK